MMGLDLRAQGPTRYNDPLGSGDDGKGVPFGAADPDWDGEDASRNPAGAISESPRIAGGGRWFRGSFTLLALAAFGGILWYAYQWGLGGGEAVDLPVVQAERGPEKVKPEDPGGLQVPYQDQLVLNRDGETAEAPRVERLLPPPEVPLPPPDATLAEIAPTYDEPLDQSAPEAATDPAAGAPDSVEQSAISTIPSLPLAPAAGPEEGGGDGQLAEAVPRPKAKPEPPVQTPAQTAEQQGAAVQQLAAVPNGSFVLQLASLKDPAAAQREWARIKGIFPNLLGDMALILDPARIDGVGKVYRLQTGPFPTRSTAADVCAQMKSKQQDCFVMRR